MADDADIAIAIAIAKARAKVQTTLTDQERIQAAREGTLRVSPESAAAHAIGDLPGYGREQQLRDELAIGAHPVMARAAKFAQGIPVVGEYLDEARGAIHGEAEGEALRQLQGAMDRQHPYQSAGLQLAGGVAGSVAPAVGLARVAPAVAPTGIGFRMGVAAGAGAGLGAAEGAVSGYGAGADPQSRAERAKQGAMWGGAAGGAMGLLAPVIAKGADALISRFKGKDVAVISSALGLTPASARVLKRQIEADDLAGVAAELRRAGKEGMLADGGGSLTKLLDDAMAAGGQATRIGRQAVDARAAAGQRRLTNLLDGILGKPVGVKAAQREIATRTQAARQIAYERAYAQPIDYGTGKPGDKVLAVLERVPDRTMNAAIREANEAMQAAGVRNLQIKATIADDGQVILSEMPNVQQLDEIKKALFAVAEKETDAVTGKISAAGLRAKKLGRELSEAIGEAVPPYKTATRIGGDKLQAEEAARLGRKLLLPGTSREEVADLLATKLSREAKDELKRAMRSQIDDVMANAQRTIGGGSETDIQEAMKAVKMLSSRAAREKAEQVLGHQSARVLFDQLDEVGKHLETRAAVARGSQTAGRLAGREAMDAALEPGPLGRAVRGEPVAATKSVVQLLTGRTPLYDQARKQQMYAELARALTEARGPDAMRSLSIIEKAIQGQPVKDAEAALVARTLAATSALSGYQLGTQLLPQQ